MRTPLWPIAVAGLAAIAVILWCLQLDTTGLERLLLLNRYLARLGFLMFIPIYAATPLGVWFPGAATRGLLRVWRSLGLGYALIMAAHLLAIGAYQLAEGSESIDWVAGLGGGLGFVLIAALAATSNDAAMRRLGAKVWKRLHRSALHWLWVIYAITYLGRVTDRSAEWWPGLATIFALLALRLSIRLRPSRS